ncbi:T9SS type A sorting domain-containing protein (plasmid) [Pedobacter sp. BS3]|uniref:right-handed parallel beta-helix repeat-containing protein n=1 Tax=Pedobacter sp. BS3 TaxID=2567937 RepID=UPI0011EBE345|nr:right-handed parallel beta-helix repeat-containing protein [Pedobacter sp. BS3]TZF86247.1 T9SS type A sorting domain-containing protein [Pedobacter sp. BS3]
MKKYYFTLLLCLAISMLKAQTTIYFVTTDGVAGNSGADWDNAKTLAAAISAATDGDMIFVKKGTYTAASGLPLIDLTGTKSGVKLYGGFAGTETSLGDRVFGTTAADSTNFVGNGSRVIANAGTVTPFTKPITYDGFTIKDGSVDASGGGGMNNFNANAIVTNCIFKGNKTTTSGNGGALYSAGGPITITNCMFYGNTSAGSGGAVIISSASNADITSCTFDSNTAPGYGGGLYTYMDVANPTTITITNCTFIRNKSTRATYSGGGLTNENTNPIVTNCTFRGNEASVGSGASGGGVLNLNTTTAKFINCLFSGNKGANAGGGVYNFSAAGKTCTPAFINCTIAGNNAASIGGAMCNTGAAGSGTNPVIINCIIYGNNHGIWNNATNGATATVTYSDVQYAGVANETNYSSGTGNINADPMFSNSPAFVGAPFTTGDYTLGSNSGSVIDKGLNSAISGYDFDITGINPRIYNGVRVDMGAYEYQSVLPVTVSAFTASLVNNRTQLKWSVGTENNVKRYEIERSQNGIDFVNVATVSANGSASYNTTDASPQLGVNYYRLVTVDNDGTTARYKDIQTVKVTSLAIESILIYPNPVKGNVINMALNGYTTGNYSYKLVNEAGATVQQGSVNYGSSNVSIATTAPAGVYVLYLSHGNSVVKAKLVKL